MACEFVFGVRVCDMEASLGVAAGFVMVAEQGLGV